MFPNRLVLRLASILLGIQLVGVISFTLPPTTVWADEAIIVHGFVWYDDDRDGKLDSGEERAAGATVAAGDMVVKVL
ncbi:MAG: hypothetical protein M1136_10635, partial [Chloroflexi bacterium]|nr:hypothetical protein [Chloroflexota bacterium]MCL4459820.1 hypothetical protein [Chloroflexota bacterium]MCL5076082.1 hypothetical protein [Chloroflexota bacterium]